MVDVLYSDDSEGSDIPGMVNQGLSSSGTSTSSSRSPRTPPMSPDANDSLMIHDKHRHSHRKTHGHHSTSKDYMKLLMSEDLEAKQTRRVLRTALERLDNETRRAQEAERRALELAERFKVVNDARITAQQDFARVSEELKMYKVQYEHAQREILRGQDILKEMEAQRDDAEAVAARARTTARRLKEEKLMILAREEGRKAGYQEGFRRGQEEAKYDHLNKKEREIVDEDRTDTPTASSGRAGGSKADPLDELRVRNLPSPRINSVSIESPRPKHATPPKDSFASRFHEHGIGISPAPTNNSLPGHTLLNPPAQRPKSAYQRPISVPYGTSSPSHPEMHLPPDGWIPKADADNYIPIPPPHEFTRPPPSPSSPSIPLPIPPPLDPMEHQSRSSVDSQDSHARPPVARDYGHRRSPSLTESIPTSIPSTTFSQFDIIAPPEYNRRDRGLSVIHEVSSSMEFSPGTEIRGIPEPLVFPSATPTGQRPRSAYGGSQRPDSVLSYQEQPKPIPMYEASQTPRSMRDSQRFANNPRYPYDMPEEAAQWERTTELRAGSTPSRSSLGSRHAELTVPSPYGNRPSSRPSYQNTRSMSGRSDLSSDYDITIQVEPPSGTSSSYSPTVPERQSDYMLSPNKVPSPLPDEPPSPSQTPQPPAVPTAPNSPSVSRLPSMGVLPLGFSSGFPSPGTMPSGLPTLQTLPQNFVPLGPPIPTSTTPAPQGSPRMTAGNIYGYRNPPAGAPVPVPPPRPPSSASSAADVGRPKSRHSRAASVSSAGDNYRPKTPSSLGPGRPPSASALGGSRTVSAPGYAFAPTPPGVAYPEPPRQTTSSMASPRSTTSRLSGSAAGHYRSLSLNAGSTPATHSNRPLSAAPPPKLRRVPSDESQDSAMSGRSDLSEGRRKSGYARYQPDEYVDAAFLASNEDLTEMNTKVNSTGRRGSIYAAGRG